jgi:hypothetical protein
VTRDLPLDITDRVAGAFKNLRGVLATATSCSPATASSTTACPASASSRGGRDQLWRHRPAAARRRRAVRRPQGAAVLGYERFDFEVPVGEKGDNYDRFLIRVNEIEQSMRIVEQGLREIPDGPIRIDDPRYVLPEKHDVYNSIEGLMHHFKLIMEGAKVPAGRGLPGRRRAATASSASTSSATAAAVRIAAACGRRASTAWARSARCSKATWSPTSSPPSAWST